MTDEDRELAAAGARFSRALAHRAIEDAERRHRHDLRRNWRMERGLLWFAIGVGAFLAWLATFGRFWWLYWAAWQVYTYQRWRDERRAFAAYTKIAIELPAARLLRGDRRAP